jgi:hypothetical protein
VALREFDCEPFHMTITSASTGVEGMALASVCSTNETTATTLPIGSWAGQAYRTIARLIVPVAPGDVLDIDGRARVTNDASEPRYNVGVETGLWGYDVDTELGSSGAWWLLDAQTGDNVTPDRHHLPVAITGVYTVPADWPAGHRLVVVLRCDAESTAARAGDALTVNKLTRLTVRRWTAPPAS